MNLQDGDCSLPHVDMGRGAVGTGVGGALILALVATDAARATTKARDRGVRLGNKTITTSNYTEEETRDCH